MKSLKIDKPLNLKKEAYKELIHLAEKSIELIKEIKTEIGEDRTNAQFEIRQELLKSFENRLKESAPQSLP